MKTLAAVAFVTASFATILPCSADVATPGAEAEVVEAAVPPVDETEGEKWWHIHAFADIETAYICRGYVWDSRPFSAQFVSGDVRLGGFGRVEGYVWSMSALSCKGHSTSMRNAYNEVDYGIRYAYDWQLAEDWTLVSGVGKQWVTNPGVRHNAHSLIDWQAFQSLRNPFITPYWRLRYIRRPYQAAYWCVGLMHEFELTKDLSFTVDFFGDMGDNRHYQHLFGPKQGNPNSRYHGGIHALNLVLRLDWRATENLGFYAFAGQFCLVNDDARDAVGASTAPEAKRDLTYGGVGIKFDF